MLPYKGLFFELIFMLSSRMEFKTFSCYDNFVPCNNCGAPEHTPTHYTLQHFERLLQCTSARLRNLPMSQLRPQAPKDLVKSPESMSSTNDSESCSSDTIQDMSMSSVSHLLLIYGISCD